MTTTGHRRPLDVPFAVTRDDRIPARRYYDPDFYARECEEFWPHVWQMACRLEEIPRVGDFVEYKILDQSVIVVRAEDMSVKAFHNARRHRGVTLVEDRGNRESGFTCPFHGWCFGLDGANTWLYQPSLYDEAQLDPDDLGLRPCRVDTWGGCAFVNFDDDAPPLRDSIEPFATYHDFWKVEHLRAEWWLAAELPVNWKLAMEAFMEGYHTLQTHPQFTHPGQGGKHARYTPIDGVTPTLEAPKHEAVQVDSRVFIDTMVHYMRVLSEGMAGMTHMSDVRVAEGLRDIQLPSDAPDALAEWRRQLNDAVVAWHRAAGAVMPDLNDIEQRGLISPVNFCFPHYFLLPVFSSASSYRIRPLGPETTLFEIWSLTRYPEGQEPEPPPTPVPMAPDDPRWPPVPTQDFSNLPRQQRGLHTKGFEFMRLSKHVEGTISNYQRLIDGYLAGLDPDLLVEAVHQVNGPIDQPVKDLGF